MNNKTDKAPALRCEAMVGQAYSELTLKTEGWYFFYPANPRKYERPHFVELSQETIDDGDLHCRMGQGTYIGPIIPPSPPNIPVSNADTNTKTLSDHE